jgi:hypothetical protein
MLLAVVLISICLPSQPNKFHTVTSGRMVIEFRMHEFDKAVMPPIQQFSPHVQATQLYRVMSPYAIWVGPEYCLKTEESQNILESKTKKLSTCCNSVVYSSGSP